MRSSGTLARAAMAAALVLLCAGCQPGKPVKLRYLPGFVPGSENIFRPVKVAVTPVSGEQASGRVRVGAIYKADGTLDKTLYVTDAGPVMTQALMRGLNDAGVKPIALDAPPPDGKPPPGTDYLMNAQLEQMTVDKHFGAEKTVHGQYFTMKAMVRIKFELVSRAGGAVYSGELTGLEQEPPAPVGGEVFLPLETEPSESLSVAMSRAIGALMLQPEVQANLPLRVSTLPASAPARVPPAARSLPPAPSAAASPPQAGAPR
jgi:hypothetical protein